MWGCSTDTLPVYCPLSSVYLFVFWCLAMLIHLIEVLSRASVLLHLSGNAVLSLSGFVPEMKLNAYVWRNIL